MFSFVNVLSVFSVHEAMNNQPILFVSSRCSHSKQILDTLKSLNKDSLCRVFNIDGRQRTELPGFLKSVPTLYIPESKDVYIGKDIFAYIAKPVTSRREIPVNASATKATPAAGQSGFEAWSFDNTGKLTDSFSSWDKPNQFVGDQLNYSFLGSTALTPTPPEPKTSQSYEGDKTNRNGDINSRLEEYKKMRDTEFKGISRQ